jgi:GTPase SAR1 family protein
MIFDWNEECEKSMVLSSYLKTVHKVRKILILGSGAVGKTSLVKVLKNGKMLQELQSHNLNYHRTPFLELDTLSARGLVKDDIEGTFQVYDVAGQFDQPFHPLKDLTHTVLSNVDLIVLVFSLNNVQSLLDLAQWIRLVNMAAVTGLSENPAKYILVSNKIDLERAVDKIVIENILENEPRIVKYFEISCMSGIGVNKLKEWLIQNYFSN